MPELTACCHAAPLQPHNVKRKSPPKHAIATRNFFSSPVSFCLAAAREAEQNSWQHSPSILGARCTTALTQLDLAHARASCGRSSVAQNVAQLLAQGRACVVLRLVARSFLGCSHSKFESVGAALCKCLFERMGIQWRQRQSGWIQRERQRRATIGIRRSNQILRMSESRSASRCPELSR